MIRSTIRWAVQNHAAMNLIMVAAFIVGAVSLLLLRREIFPAFRLEIVVVSVLYPGASPDEVEDAICQKVEASVRAITGVKNVTAIAQESVGTVVLELHAAADVERALADIRSAVDRIPSFPVLAEDPEIQQITFRTSAIRVGIVSDQSSAADAELSLRGFTEHIRDELLQLRNVSQATIVGERPYQIDVEISEENLRKYGLTLQKVADLLRRENVEIPGGKIQASGQSMLLRGKNKRVTGAEIGELPLVSRPDGTVLTVSDLGTVYDGFEDTLSYQRLQGNPAMVISVDRTDTEDLLRIVDDVKKYVADKSCPAGYSLLTMNDTSVDVRERIDLLTEDGLQGLLLVLLVLAIFLEFRLAVWVAMGIPFAILATCGVLYFTGGTLNMLTMFSFLMAMGILVDDAIVISENFHTHRMQGKGLAQSAVDATTEVAGSVTVGVLCTVIAFVPLFFVSGIMGKFIACMPLPVIAMLLISLAEGLTILACHLGHDNMLDSQIGMLSRIRQAIGRWNIIHFLLFGVLPWIGCWLLEQCLRSYQSMFRLCKRVFDPINVVSDRFVNFSVGRFYLPAVRRAMQHIPVVLALGFAFLIASMVLVQGGYVKRVLFPTLDSRTIVASVRFPDGTPIEVTDEAVQQLASAIREVSAQHSVKDVPLAKLVHEVVGGAAQLNTVAEGEASGESAGSVIVELCGAGDRNLKSTEIIDLWREKTGSIVGAEETVFGGNSMGPGGKAIEFKLQADREHWGQLQAATQEVVDQLKKYEGVAEVADDLFEGKWEYHIRINERARGMGVSTADLAETIRASFFGQEVMRLQRGRHEVKLMVRYPKGERENLMTLESIRVRGDDGVERPIAELADVKMVRGYTQIQRVDQKRAITVSGDVSEKGNANEIINDLQKSFMPQIYAKYPNVSVRWEGQRQQDAESMSSMGLGVLIALFAMYLLLTFQLKSLLEPFIILCVIPFAVCGAIWGHYAMGLELTLFSFFGLVALTGMVVNDSIVLLDFINLRISEKHDESLIESIVEAGRRRIRPMALNTVTSIIGIIPLVSNTSYQAQVLVPMGVSLVFGLAASTLTGLFVIPVLFYLLAQIDPPHDDHTWDDDQAAPLPEEVTLPKPQPERSVTEYQPDPTAARIAASAEANGTGDNGHRHVPLVELPPPAPAPSGG